MTRSGGSIAKLVELEGKEVETELTLVVQAIPDVLVELAEDGEEGRFAL